MHSAKLISRAITNDHAAPSMPNAGSPAQPNIRNGAINTCSNEPTVITMPGIAALPAERSRLVPTIDVAKNVKPTSQTAM